MSSIAPSRMTSRSSSPATISRSPEAPSIKSLYRSATSAFLVRDYAQTSEALQSAQRLLSSTTSSSEWIQGLMTANTMSNKDEWSRKVTIFQMTFLATCRSHPSAATSISLQPSHQKYIEIPVDTLIPSFWHHLILHDTTSSSTEILATPQASSIHPSLIVALTLAALKLERPRQARAALESYLGSISEELESLIEDSARLTDWESECNLVETMNASQTLGSSTAMGNNDPRKALLASWLKVVDLLSLHVLPRLGEWDSAADFIRMQSHENGGFIGDCRVEAALQQLTLIQREEIEQHASRAQRQRDQKEAAVAAASAALVAQQHQQQQPARSTRSSDKGKARADASARQGETSSRGSSPVGSPGSKTRNVSKRSNGSGNSKNDESSSETGFAAMRSSLTSYLSQSVPTTTTNDTASSMGSSRSLSSVLLANLRAHDPVKLVSTICFAFAIMTWVRRTTARRRATTGKGGLGIREGLWTVIGKLGEVVKMGTKVTQL